MAEDWKDERVRDDHTVEGYTFETYRRYVKSYTFYQGRIDLLIDNDETDVSVILTRENLEKMLRELIKESADEPSAATEAGPLTAPAPGVPPGSQPKAQGPWLGSDPNPPSSILDPATESH